jgi:hypothetical protein
MIDETMVKGKPWALQEENRLKKLVEEGKSVKVMAAELGKTEQAIIKKAGRLGLEVVVPRLELQTTTLKLPKELPSVEEALRILAGALQASTQGGMGKVEVQRLQTIANLARTYMENLADYINYRGIEEKLVDSEAKYARLVQEKEKPKDTTPRPDTSQAAQPAKQ